MFTGVGTDGGRDRLGEVQAQGGQRMVKGQVQRRLLQGAQVLVGRWAQIGHRDDSVGFGVFYFGYT